MVHWKRDYQGSFAAWWPPQGGPADDGKRFSSDGRFILEVGEAKGGGLEEGGVGILRERRLADLRFTSKTELPCR